MLLPSIALLSNGLLAQNPTATPVEIQTTDGVTVFGDLYRADAPSDAPFILLFHQGGSDARSEYGPLVGPLLNHGYHALAIDQRRGGEALGGVNRTVQALGDVEYSYCEVYLDLEAALRYVIAEGYTGRRVVWGSSYSAALAFKLAAEYPSHIAGVLAFSPASGDPMAGCEPERYSAELVVPAMILRPVREMEVERVAGQLEVFREQGHQTHVADPGVHGSSMLNSARVGTGTEATWAAVQAFLQRIFAR
jgi:pimeloyl-ACP methyl ester carboxylesterase